MMWKFGVAKDYPNVAHFIARELFEHGRLRQGWGVESLDLRLGEFQWKFAHVGNWMKGGDIRICRNS